MKKLWIGSSFFIISVVTLTGIFICSPQARYSFSRAQRRSVGWYKKPMLIEYTLKSLDSIEVKSTSLNIDIKVSDSATETTVKYYTNWDGHVTDNRSSSLKIQEHWEQNWLYVFLPKMDHILNRDSYITLEITVSKETDLTRLKVTTKSGKIEITGMTADSVDLSATNQNIMVTDCVFDDTDISNVSGSTTIKNSHLGEKGNLSHSNGNMNLINCTINDDFKIEGNCTLTSCNLGDDIKIVNTTGNIKIDETAFTGITITSTSGSIAVTKIPEIDLCNFDLKATGGTIKARGTNQGTIYNVNPDSSQSWLKINATSGNIVVD